MLKFETLHSSDLMKRLTNNLFLNEFIHSLRPPVTEFFRDPNMWRSLIKNVFPKLFKKEKIRIYFPQCSSGDELYSLLIILDQLNLLHKVDILADDISEKHVENCKQGKFSVKKTETGNKNYEVLELETPLSYYITEEKKTIKLKNSLMSNVTFNPSGWFDIEEQENFDLIIFRNTLLYYNRQLQSSIINTLGDKLNKQGFIILGIKDEKPEKYGLKLNPFDKTEMIYRKPNFNGKWRI